LDMPSNPMRAAAREQAFDLDAVVDADLE